MTQPTLAPQQPDCPGAEDDDDLTEVDVEDGEEETE